MLFVDSPPADIVPFVGRHWLPDGETLPRHCISAVELADALWIGPLGDLRKPIHIACEPPGENFVVHRMHRAPYALWRTLPPATRSGTDAWDSDRKLAICLQMSRLIRPSTIAFRFACRVSYEDGKRTIAPAGVFGQGAFAFNMNREDDGIRDSDIPLLRKLLRDFEPKALPNRVKNALWMHEHLAWTRLMNIRWPLLVTALEALVHTDDRGRSRGRVMGSTEQFCARLAKLQSLLRARLWTGDDLAAVYDLRSSFAHGRGGNVDALTGEPRRLYELAENGLRHVLRAAIHRSDVADTFRSDSTVRTALGF